MVSSFCGGFWADQECDLHVHTAVTIALMVMFIVINAPFIHHFLTYVQAVRNQKQEQRELEIIAQKVDNSVINREFVNDDEKQPINSQKNENINYGAI